MEKAHSDQRGFTVLELMVATTVFAVVLMVLTVGIIRFSQDFFRGVTRSRTQSVARQIVNDIAQNIQFGQGINPNLVNSPYRGVCVDSTLYQYKLGQQVAPTDDAYNHKTKYGLVKSVGSLCSSASLATINSLSSTEHELLGNNMRLLRLSVVSGASDTWTISVTVAYGDDDLLVDSSNVVVAPGTTLSDATWGGVRCRSGISGSQFCAVSTITTTVQQRIVK